MFNWITSNRVEAILLVVFGFGLWLLSECVAYIAIDVYGFTWLPKYVEYEDRHDVYVPLAIGISMVSIGLMLSGLAKLIASVRRQDGDAAVLQSMRSQRAR